MRFFYFLFLLSATTTLSAQTFAPYCFSPNKKEGKPLFNFEDTIVLYLRPQHLAQHEILKDLPQTQHAWAGKKWLRISLHASKAEGHERQLWQNWAIASQPNQKLTNNKQIDSVSYVFSPYFAVALDPNQYKSLLRNPRTTPTAMTAAPTTADKAQRLAVLRQDSVRFAFGYAKVNTECNAFKSQYEKEFGAFYLQLQADGANRIPWNLLAEIDQNINTLTEEYLVKASPEVGRKVADLTTARAKQIAALTQEEKTYLAQYEKIAQQASSRVDICSQALALKQKLDAINEEIKTLSE
jgi:hypothetical protein